MVLIARSFPIQTQSPSTSSTVVQPSPQPSSQINPQTDAAPSNSAAAKVTVEMPTASSVPFNPFDPSWIKLWEQVGPISYLALLCIFIWLLTRFVETVKGK